MKVISQRELRNDNAKVIRGIEAGETYTVTRRGVPVAEIGPVGRTGGLRALKPATKHYGFSELKRVRIDLPSTEILGELREDRR